MSDIGTIVEIEPEDGLGWIELTSGDRVRFGGTACKGFVPAVGMAVEVLGTRPGYGGTVKATELKRAPKGAAPPAPSALSAPPVMPEPRMSLHTIQSAGVRADDLLLALLGQADVDDALHADLEAAKFEVQPQPGPSLGCPNPWFYGVAWDGARNAYGLYTHPLFDGHPSLPWLFWDHEEETLRFIALDTKSLLPNLLATAATAATVGTPNTTIAQLRATLVKLGMPDVDGAPLGDGQPAKWLPPDDAELRPVDAYLAETDSGEMERGLLAHAFRREDPRALEALRGNYQAWGWRLPSWVG